MLPHAQSAEAARLNGLEESTPFETDKENYRKSGTTVLKVQEALAAMGFYLGPIDGHLNEETEAAIRIYQKTTGQTVDGQITRGLWDLLNNAVQVRGLLKRLDEARKSGKEEARAALLANSATRDLIQDSKEERANPIRNAEQCFAEPTVRCLLVEARESGKAIFKPELRDWALGEILVAQARAGLGEQAMQSAGQIGDPRLIMVALRDIAEAQAAAGQPEQALEAVKIIPDAEKRAEALTNIAKIHARQGDATSTSRAADALIAMIDNVQPQENQITYKTQIAIALSQTGDSDRTQKILGEIEKQSRALKSATQRNLGLRHVATAFAKLKKLDAANHLLGEITTPSDREPILVSVATAQADNQQIDEALRTAETIDSRYRTAVLCHIALQQQHQPAAMEQTLELAETSIETIKHPYARSYAQSRLALTLARIAGQIAPDRASTKETASSFSKPAYFQKATTLAAQISDDRLRAHTLWSIAFEQRRHGEESRAVKTETLAHEATEAIKSRLSQAWMHSELASDHARHGANDLAWTALKRGLSIGQTIDNPWGRARALAKLAQTLIELVSPGVGQEDKSFAN